MKSLVFKQNLNHNDISFIESLLQSLGHVPPLPKLKDFLGDSSTVMCYSNHHHHHLGVREQRGLRERIEFEIFTI